MLESVADIHMPNQPTMTSGSKREKALGSYSSVFKDVSEPCRNRVTLVIGSRFSFNSGESNIDGLIGNSSAQSDFSVENLFH